MTTDPAGPRIPEGPAYTELIPRPDPSKLTDEAIARSTAQYRRELDEMRVLLGERIEVLNTSLRREVVAARDSLELRAELRETAAAALKALLEARMDAMDAATNGRFDQVTAASAEHAIARDKAVAGLQELLESRLDGMDRATELLAADVRQVPTVLQFNISSLRELMESKLAGMEQAVLLQNRQWEK